MRDASSLPEEIETLKRLLANRDETITRLLAEIARLRRWRFGRSAERVDASLAQLQLALDALQGGQNEAGPPAPPALPPKSPRRNPRTGGSSRCAARPGPFPPTCRARRCSMPPRAAPALSAARRCAHIEALIEGGGQILIGTIAPINGAAVAHDGKKTLVMLRRRAKEPMAKLLARLDEAIVTSRTTGQRVDEINSAVPGKRYEL